MDTLQKAPLTFSEFDRHQGQVPVSSVPAWSVNDPSLGSLEVSQDGLSALFTPAGALGTAIISASADGFSPSISLEITAPGAVGAKITLGDLIDG